MSVDEAIFQAVMITALVDGRENVDDAQLVASLQAIDDRLARLPDAFELGVRAHLLVDEIGVEAALEQIVTPIVAAADRDRAFRLCARLMVADGKTDGDEALVMGTLQERFGLSHAQVRAVLDEARAQARPK
jgi:hypothetical protein